MNDRTMMLFDSHPGDVRHLCESWAEKLDTADASLPELVQGLIDFKAASAALSNVKRAIESEIAARMETSELLVDGIGLVERRYSTKRSGWDHAALGSRFLDIAAECSQLNRKTGEVESEAAALLRMILDAAGIGYWKLGALRSYGLDPDRYCTVGDPEVSVTVRGLK